MSFGYKLIFAIEQLNCVIIHGDDVAGSVVKGDDIGFKPKLDADVSIGIIINLFGLKQLLDNS